MFLFHDVLGASALKEVQEIFLMRQFEEDRAAASVAGPSFLFIIKASAPHAGTKPCVCESVWLGVCVCVACGLSPGWGFWGKVCILFKLCSLVVLFDNEYFCTH